MTNVPPTLVPNLSQIIPDHSLHILILNDISLFFLFVLARNLADDFL